MTKPKETASERRMRQFREAQERIATARQRAKGGAHEHWSVPLGEEPGGSAE